MPQSLSNLLVHLIFSTKERLPFLRDLEVRHEMHAYLGGSINHSAQSLCVGGTADHVHLLLVLPRTLCLADLVRDVKRASSLKCKSKHGTNDFSWQNGYAGFSVGQSEVPAVREYIEQQEQHHQKRTFQEEYRMFLRKYAVPYDERYVWD